MNFARLPVPGRLVCFGVWFFGAAFLFVLSGCSSDEELVGVGPGEAVSGTSEQQPASSEEATERGTDGASSEAGTGGPVTLTEADAAAYEQVVAQARGQVVLVDFWATWCVPCKKNFPKIVGYHRQYGDKGLAVVAVSIDDEEAHEDALAFLESVGATFTNLRSRWGAGTESAERFDFSGEVPYYKLYDRQGKLRYQFAASADIDDSVEPIEQMKTRIEQLLEE